MPFDNFNTKPTFGVIEDYLIYKKGVMDFIKARNIRIEAYKYELATEQKASR